MPNSYPVIAGVSEVLASQYNYLRADVLDETTGHSHTGDVGGGQKIQFSDLSASDDAAPQGLNNSLNEIDAHIGSVAGTGSSGVHGLPSVGRVLGITNGAGYVTIVGSSTITSGTTKTVSFDQTFSGTPYIFVQGVGDVSGNAYIGYTVTALTSTNFTVKNAGTSPLTFHWMAIGTLA